MGPFKSYVTQMGVGGGCHISGIKRYEGARFNIVGITRGGWGSNLRGKSITYLLN